MTMQSKSNLVVLIEDEIRTAEKALEYLRDNAGKLSADDEFEAFHNALRACMTALYGAEKDDHSILLAPRAALISETAVQS
jgi:hypothetical protein